MSVRTTSISVRTFLNAPHDSRPANPNPVNAVLTMTSPVTDPDETHRAMPGHAAERGSLTFDGHVYLVDDDPAVIRVAAEMRHGSGYEVRGYSSAMEFLKESEHLPPGVVITDQEMKGIGGIEIQRHLSARPNHFKVILVSAFPKTSLAVEAMKNGAVTVLDKPLKRTELLAAGSEAFRQLKNANAFDEDLPPHLPSGESYLDRLSIREREVILMIYRGATNKVTGVQLGISFKTVEKHRSSAMKKLEVSSLVGLVRLLDRELSNK